MLNPRLIVSIVRRGWGDTVLEASMKAGAHGGTVVFGRGIGRNEQQRVFGIQIEPEKEIVLTVVPQDIVNTVLEAITTAAELTVPGHGLAFVVPVEAVAGVVHLVDDSQK
ncbi:MAG: P-II family nitrogen regulator [Gammaproteobacteria bacterium]|nr:transcriptional regulator [Gammaproteobacteria bacterium]